MKRKLNLVILILILPLVFSIITHFGYISSYTKGVFSEETFSSQYDNGIYKYRILSNYLLIETSNLLINSKLDNMNNMLSDLVKFLDSNGKLSFYFSYFILNSIFFVLSAYFFYKIISSYVFFNLVYIDISLILYSAIIPLFQYVIVPYDYSAYFFNNLIIFIFIKNYLLNQKKYIFLLILLIILSTLNRETSALTISFMAALVLAEKHKILTMIKTIAAPAITFLIVYFTLRFYFGFDSGIINKLTFMLNLISPLNLFGIFVGLVSFYIIFIFVENKIAKMGLIYFFIFSLPYIIITLISGITFEIRLWTPLIINSTIILLYFNNRSITK